VDGKHTFGWGPTERPGYLWAGRVLFVLFFVLLVGLSFVQVSDGVGRSLLSLSFVLLFASLICLLMAGRPGEPAYGSRRTGAEVRRGRFRTAALSAMAAAVAAMALTPLVPARARVALLPMIGLFVIVGCVLLVFAQPTRSESDQTDLGKPSPRGRLGIGLLLMITLLVASSMVEHALSVR
jgi:hypothetical protein